MKRDMDLIRNLLLQIEGGKTSFQIVPKSHAAIFGIANEDAMEDELASKMQRHLELLQEAGLASFFATLDGEWLDAKITWLGYEFLETVKDPEIWDLAKNGAANAGGAGLELLGQLAKGLIKTKIEQHTGIDIG